MENVMNMMMLMMMLMMMASISTSTVHTGDIVVPTVASITRVTVKSV